MNLFLKISMALVTLLSLNGCFGPKFTTGDCIKTSFPDGKQFYLKIQSVSEYGYQIFDAYYPIRIVDKFSEKVDNKECKL